MTADEAVRYVRRRKDGELYLKGLTGVGLMGEAILMECAKGQEGKTAQNSVLAAAAADRVTRVADSGAGLPPSIHFNPPFRIDAVPGPSRARATLPTVTVPDGTESPVSETPPQSVDFETSKPEQSLADVLDNFVKLQKVMSNGGGKGGGRNREIEEPVRLYLLIVYGKADEAKLVDEEGLPIHEIREDAEGRPLGPASVPTDEVLVLPAIADKPADDYWSKAAVARRAALTMRVFHQGKTSDEETQRPSSAEPAKVERIPTLAQSTVSSDVPPPPIRPQSSTTQPPKSILKPPARKKSVSFDESVPPPPDSPGQPGSATNIGGTVFPMPMDEFAPKPVPVIQEPKPAVKKQVGEKGFAGFKRGFLGGSVKATPRPALEESGGAENKTSLFAQRKAGADDSSIILTPKPPVKLPAELRAAGRSAANLPKMSDSKAMASLKPAVVERIGSPSSPSSSAIEVKTTASRLRRDDGMPIYGDEDEDEDKDQDDPSEEEEYDLDDALLVREAALEYHRRRVYQSRDPDEEEDENGGVMLALPLITDGARIVNPTLDDLRRFVRVGKLENGKLVLAPGQAGWSDEDEDGQMDENVEKSEGRRRKKEMKRRLLGLDGDWDPPAMSVSEDWVQDQVTEVRVPPVVTAAVKEARPVQPSSPSATLPAAPPQDSAPPKKVSRFKAARMGT